MDVQKPPFYQYFRDKDRFQLQSSPFYLVWLSPLNKGLSHFFIVCKKKNGAEMGQLYIKIDKSVDFYNEVVYIYCVE